LSLLPLLLAVAPFAQAQSSFDVNLGFGSFHNKANGGGIDNANSLTNPFGLCAPNTGDPFCQATPALSGLFMGFGGDVMLQKHYGVGMEFNITPARQDYASLQYRQLFYDFNGIYAPINEKKVQLQLQGGIGGARTSFALTQSGCVGPACSTVTQPIGNNSHFQLHVGVGIQIFVTEHIFIRPQFDYHFVPNFTNEFGSKSVPGGMVWIGYSFGDRT
jgi:opacity protein-like surface antigen